MMNKMAWPRNGCTHAHTHTHSPHCMANGYGPCGTAHSECLEHVHARTHAHHPRQPLQRHDRNRLCTRSCMFGNDTNRSFSWQTNFAPVLPMLCTIHLSIGHNLLYFYIKFNILMLLLVAVATLPNALYAVLLFALHSRTREELVNATKQTQKSRNESNPYTPAY